MKNAKQTPISPLNSNMDIIFRAIAKQLNIMVDDFSLKRNPVLLAQVVKKAAKQTTTDIPKFCRKMARHGLLNYKRINRSQVLISLTAKGFNLYNNF